MWKNILRWALGYLIIVVSGKEKERFINICIKKRIEFWNVKEKKAQLTMHVLLIDFWRIKEIAFKTKVMARVQKRLGLPFVIRRIKVRKGALFGAITGGVFVWLLSTFLWSIQIQGQCQISREDLLRFLERKHVSQGMELDTVDCGEIEEYIREGYKNVSWVSVELIGSKLFVRIVEGKQIEKEKNKLKKAHLISPRNAKVVSIVARTGIPVVKSGEQVKKGDVLISGLVPLYNDNGELEKNKLVSADGDVMLSYVEKLKEECCIDYTVRKYTGWKKTCLGISLAGNEIFFGNPLKRFNKCKKYDIISSVQGVFWDENYLFPIKLCSKQAREYQNIEKKHSEAEAIQIVNQRMDSKLSKFNKRKQIQVLSRTICTKTDSVVLTACVEMRELAREYREVRESEWRTK